MNSAVDVAPQRGAQAYCPHCFLLVEAEVEGAWPPVPTRCPHCRLLIGAGRARSSPTATPGARGAAAGVFSSRATRSEGVEPSIHEIGAAIRAVAEEMGVAPDRLLMIDYQQRVAGAGDLPQLGDVLASFGSWKQARREAARG